MYKKLVPVTPSDHAGLLWTQARAYSFASDSLFLPIAPIETLSLISEFPIVFGQTQQGFSLGILTGLQPGASAAIGPDGRWRGAYVPAVLRTAPFSIAQTGPDTLTLLVDEDSALVSRVSGQPMLGPDQTVHPNLKPTVDILVRWEQTRITLAPKLLALVAAGLLTHDLTIATADGHRINLQGVRVIRPEQLASLSPEAVLSLHQAGALELAYLAASSLVMLERLGHLSTLDRQQQAAAAPSLLGPEWFG